MPTSNDRIEVSPTPLPTVLASALRYLVTIGGTLAVSRGWVPAENLEGIATLVITAATVGYGLYKTYKNRSNLIVAARAAPNDVAVVTK